MNLSKQLQKRARGSLVVCATLLLLAGRARAQEPIRTLEQIYQFDDRGDAKIEFNFQLGKAQWDVWKMRYGDHPDEMLRTINHDMAAAVIDDFGLDKDETHRRATAHFKARALAQYRGNGEFEIQLPKTMKLVTGSGLDWAFTSSMSEKTPTGTGLVNVTYRAKLPPKAKDAHVINGNDYSRLAYSLEVSPPKPYTLLYAGLGLIFAAIVFLILANRKSQTPTVRTSPPSSSGALPAN
ncbi:MAG: hypothetical protein M3Y27_26615 [Acidobacteriota bacterium]|nr:hypothetical protein [Acidobacteriota bacterium]